MWIDPNVAYHACGTVPPFSRGPGFWVMDAKMLVDPIELGQLGITCFGTPTDQLHLVSGIVCRENFFLMEKLMVSCAFLEQTLLNGVTIRGMIQKSG